jgi:hypothetical protein
MLTGREYSFDMITQISKGKNIQDTALPKFDVILPEFYVSLQFSRIGLFSMK